jgi:GNAT superfamily N-acetyltransferase
MFMEWFERLNEYFPDHEMKDPRQLQALIEDQDVYHKEETNEYLLLYAEFPTFIFIDYLLIKPEMRGKGVGTKILNQLKQKGKDIILEVEPIDRDDEETLKRANFYRKNGFIKADRIQYEREDQSGDPYEMKIYYWSLEENLPQEVVLEKMSKACQEIHNFRSERYYGREVADPENVLSMKDSDH